MQGTPPGDDNRRLSSRLLGSSVVLLAVMATASVPYLFREHSPRTGILVNDDLPVYFYLSQFGSTCIRNTEFDLGYDPRYLCGCIQTPYFTLSTYVFKVLMTHLSALPEQWVYYCTCMLLTFVVPFIILKYARNMASLLGYDHLTANQILLLFVMVGALRSVFLHSSMLPMYAASALALYYYSSVAQACRVPVAWKKIMLLASLELIGTYLHMLFPVMTLPAIVYLLGSKNLSWGRRCAYVALCTLGTIPLLRPLAIASLSSDLAVYNIPWFGMQALTDRLFYYFDFSFEHFDTVFGLFFVIPFLASLSDKGLWTSSTPRFFILSAVYLYALVVLPFFERLHSMRFEPIALGLAAGFFPLGYQRLRRVPWLHTILVPVMVTAVLIPVIVISIFTAKAIYGWQIPPEMREMAQYLEHESQRLNVRVLMEDAEGLPQFRNIEWESSPHYKYNTHLGTYLSFFADIPFTSGYKFDYPFVFNYDRFAHGMLRDRPLAQWRLEELIERLNTSNTGLIVVWSQVARQFFLDHQDMFSEQQRFADFTVFHYLLSPRTYLINGDGVVRSEINKLRITDVKTEADGPLVLRFHWVQGLRADPCTIEPWPVEGQPVPLIRVDMAYGTKECTIHFDPKMFINDRLATVGLQRAQARGLRALFGSIMETVARVVLLE